MYLRQTHVTMVGILHTLIICRVVYTCNDLLLLTFHQQINLQNQSNIVVCRHTNLLYSFKLEVLARSPY